MNFFLETWKTLNFFELKYLLRILFQCSKKFNFIINLKNVCRPLNPKIPKILYLSCQKHDACLCSPVSFSSVCKMEIYSTLVTKKNSKCSLKCVLLWWCWRHKWVMIMMNLSALYIFMMFSQREIWKRIFLGYFFVHAVAVWLFHLLLYFDADSPQKYK